jgi:hypothetical protein
VNKKVVPDCTNRNPAPRLLLNVVKICFGGVSLFSWFFERLWIGTSAFVIKYQEFEPAILADIEKPKSKDKPEKPEELWVVQLVDKID